MEVVFRSPWSHFTGLGHDPITVPIYLRFHGTLQNFNLSHAETDILVNEFWTWRDLNPQILAIPEEVPKSFIKKDKKGIKVTERHPFESIFMQFLKFKCSKLHTDIEMGYNFSDSLKKYQDVHSGIRLLWLILTGDAAEALRLDQKQMMNDLKNALLQEMSKNQQNAENVERMHRLPIETFIRTIKKALPTKSQHNIDRLAKVLSFEMKQNVDINLTNLLNDFEEGIRNPFTESLCQQHITESYNYSIHLLSCIDRFCDPTNLVNKTTTIGRLREAILFSDSNKTRVEINQYLSRGLNLNIEEVLLMEAKKSLVRVKDFKMQLKTISVLKKSAPLNKFDS